MANLQSTALGLILSLGWFCSAHAHRTIDLSTSAAGAAAWIVREKTDGMKVAAAAVVNPGYNYGDVPAITIPFTNCDGYWVAERRFHLPIGATNAVLTVTGLGVDDRAVIQLNRVAIASVGTLADGKGSMQLRDPGRNRSYKFGFISGTAHLSNTANLVPGLNILRVIVNNTGHGIDGEIVPINASSPSEFGIIAQITYKP